MATKNKKCSVQLTDVDHLIELRANIAAMDPKSVRELKDHYYSAASALREIITVLETVDAALFESMKNPSRFHGSDALLHEVLLMSAALDQFNRSNLGDLL